MKNLKKFICTIGLISIMLFNSSGVKATEISVEDYYRIINEYTNSNPYNALSMLIEVHKLYPSDKKIINDMDENAKVILSWSKGSQIKGNYDEAIRGYDTILSTEGVSQIVKQEANICLIFANRREEGIISRLDRPEYYDLVSKYQKEYTKSNYEFQSLKEYNTFGNYLFIENTVSFSNPEETRFDTEGIPMVNYNGEFCYNPVTIEQYALTLYDMYLKNTNNTYAKNEFIKVSDWLVKRIDVLGALSFKFDYKYYLDENELKSGWVSAMAQGEALSVFARAYHLTGNSKYVNSGNLVFRYLTRTLDKGGVTDNLGSLNRYLSEYPFFQLYVTNPKSYTLNGHMFTLIGLYDWSNLEGNGEISKSARQYFDKGLATLKYILPYYDIGGFVTYDLGYLTKPGIEPTVNFNYYGIHLTLLDALYMITEDKTFKDYKNLWASYVVKY